MDEGRLKTSDIAEALGVKPQTLTTLAHNLDIQGEKDGMGRGRGRQTRYTIEQAEALARAHQGEEGVKQLYNWMVKVAGERDAGGDKKQGESERERDMTFQRALSDSYARMTRRMTEETDWWIEAITKIGHSTVLIALQEAKIPPEEVYDEVKKLKSADEFIARVDEYMSALYEAKNDAKSLVEKNKEMKVLTYKLLFVKEVSKELVRRLKGMENMFNLAVSNLDEEGLRKVAILTPMITGNSIQNQEKEEV